MKGSKSALADGIRYDILAECACGPEEFFVLVSSVDHEEPAILEVFLVILSELSGAGLATCLVGGRLSSPPTLEELRSYVAARLKAGEALDEFPEACPEYSFQTTDAGLLLLNEEDRPEKRG